MKVKFKNIDKVFKTDEINTIKDFIGFLQSELSLSDNIQLNFLDKREGRMTTGVRKNNSEISILCGNRLLIDVLRTIAHEWVHEYQFMKMGVNPDKKIQDIGGPEENMANTLAGIFIKKFQKLNPDLETVIYNE